MHLTFRNCNDAFTGLVEGIHTGRIPTEVLPSRYGEVLVIEEPVLITYTHPLERVLFNAARDANPFFHLYESLWMLAGRNDVAPLAYYCSRMPEFSDDGETFNGAYGWRWRHSLVWTFGGVKSDSEGKVLEYPKWLQGERDQLVTLINHLRDKPESRRAVLQMWNVEDDLLKIDESRDVCCNLNVMFAVEQGPCSLCNGTGLTRVGRGRYEENSVCSRCKGLPHDQPRYLNMTVCNRSNDLTWGLLGSNYVCFSVLQEYVAARLGLEVGRYHHFTNNLHAYTNKWHPQKWLEGRKLSTDYRLGVSTGPALVKDVAAFDRELLHFVEKFSGKTEARSLSGEFSEPFLLEVAQPLLLAFASYKEKDYQRSLMCADGIAADDWHIAAEGWLQRHIERRSKRSTLSVPQEYDPDLAV